MELSIQSFMNVNLNIKNEKTNLKFMIQSIEYYFLFSVSSHFDYDDDHFGNISN